MSTNPWGKHAPRINVTNKIHESKDFQDAKYMESLCMMALSMTVRCDSLAKAKDVSRSTHQTLLPMFKMNSFARPRHEMEILQKRFD